MKISRVDRAIAQFEAQIAVLQKCIDQLRGLQSTARPRPTRPIRRRFVTEEHDESIAALSSKLQQNPEGSPYAKR